MAEELILHAGLAKTGTTAIQRALAASRDTLRQRDVLYPGPEGDHHHLQSMFSENPEALIQIGRLGLNDAATERGFIANYRVALEREIKAADCKRIVLSSEYIPAMRKSELASLAAYLRSFASNFRVIIFLRDPWSMTISTFQEELRTGIWSGPVRLGYRGDMRDHLEHLEQGLGTNLEAQIYDGDSVAQMSKCLGIPLLAPDERSNEAIGFHAACMLTQLNKCYPQFVNGRYVFDGARDWMAQAVCHAFPNIAPVRMSKRTAASIFEQGRADLAAVSAKYFGSQPVFEKFYAESLFSDDDDEISVDRLSPDVISEGMLRALHFLAERGAYFFKSSSTLADINSTLIERLAAQNPPSRV